MTPKFLHPDRFEAVVADGEEHTFLLPRTLYVIRWDDGFCLRDRNGECWRPAKREYKCDLSSVPHPFTLLPCFIPTRYKRAAAIHDYACRYGHLEKYDPEPNKWIVVAVPRWKADQLIADGLDAEGAWRVTEWAYYGGVRVGAGLVAIKKFVFR